MEAKTNKGEKKMIYQIREDLPGIGVKTVVTFDKLEDAQTFLQRALTLGHNAWIKTVA